MGNRTPSASRSSKSRNVEYTRHRSEGALRLHGTERAVEGAAERSPLHHAQVQVQVGKSNWSTAVGSGMLPPGSVRDDSGLPGLDTRTNRRSWDRVCTEKTPLNSDEAYSSANLLHRPRLRLNSVADGTEGPTLRERRNSILSDNLQHLQLMVNMSDEDVTHMGMMTRVHRSGNGALTVTKHGRKRRNSSNSIFLTETAANILDHKALVKCISTAFFSSIQDVPGRVTKQYQIFVDPDNLYFCRPLYRDVYRFVNNVFMKAQLESEVLIISLVYFERLLLVMNAELVVGFSNWRAIILACTVLASKVWDDLSMINADFSTIMGDQFTLKHINQLEIALLSALKFDVKVSLSTYALYYFKLRTMLGPGGLFGEGTEPLSIQEAKQMSALSSSFARKLNLVEQNRRRTSTIGTAGQDDRAKQISTASLEHIISKRRMESNGRHINDYEPSYSLRVTAGRRASAGGRSSRTHKVAETSSTQETRRRRSTDSTGNGAPTVLREVAQQNARLNCSPNSPSSPNIGTAAFVAFPQSAGPVEVTSSPTATSDAENDSSGTGLFSTKSSRSSSNSSTSGPGAATEKEEQAVQKSRRGRSGRVRKPELVSEALEEGQVDSFR